MFKLKQDYQSLIEEVRQREKELKDFVESQEKIITETRVFWVSKENKTNCDFGQRSDTKGSSQ